MGIPGSANPMLFGGAGAYQINQSLRFNSADSAYLERTTGGTAGSQTTWTFSCWVKRSKLGTAQYLFNPSVGGDSTNESIFQFNTSDKIRIYDSGATRGDFVTTQVFRDTSAWYHIVVALDTTQGTSTNRFKLYVNGVQVTTFDTASYPGSSVTWGWNRASTRHRIGAYAYPSTASNFGDFYLTEIHHIDGTALTPSSFGETDTITGAWIPKKYSGSYGTNGFYLKFADNSGTTSTTLGKDSSGNGNNWTPNNFSVTAGAGNDVLSDSPTNNYAAMNPIDAVSTSSVSNGNLVTSNTNNASSPGIRSTFSMSSGKWYWEVTCGTFTSAATWMLGIQESNATVSNWQAATTYAYYSSNGQKYNSGSGSTYGNTYTTNDVIGIAYDADNGKLYFAKNNTWQNSGDPIAGTGAAWSGLTGSYSAWVGTGLYTVESIFNFGQRAFEYTPPTGYKALNTSNLPAPDIADGSDYFNTVLWTGDGASSRSITGVGFQPDWVWTKKRNSAQDHFLYDAVRGSTNGNFLELRSNSTAAENSPSTADTGMRSFDSNGFTIGSDGSVNTNNDTYVAWNWLAGGSGSSNTAGDITSTVSANPTAGFSIVSWTSDAASSVRTMGHGLGNEPTFIVVKNRDVSDNWYVWHQDLPAKTYALYFTSDQQQSFGSTTIWSTSSTTFGIRQSSIATGTQDCIAYCFAEVEGYSKFGSYTGNGSSDGPFVYCGFKPAFVMIKVTNLGTTSWMMRDDKRDTDNPNSAYLLPNLSSQEFTNLDFDFLSNGFKPRHTNNVENASGYNYVFAAFASSPFGGSGVSPATAR